MDSDEIAQTKRRLAGVFDRAAPTYDRVGPRHFWHFGRRLVELAGIASGDQVLDVATGREAVLFPAAKAAGPRGHVTGIDLSEGMVQETARELAHQGLTNADIRQMDAESLQFADERFDCVLCGFALFFFPRPDRALAELYRVLKPGGRIALTTFCRSTWERWKWFDELRKAYLPPAPEASPAPDSRSPRSPGFDNPEGLKLALDTAGFTATRVIAETAAFVYADEDEVWSWLWSIKSRDSMERRDHRPGWTAEVQGRRLPRAAGDQAARWHSQVVLGSAGPGVQAISLSKGSI